MNFVFQTSVKLPTVSVKDTCILAVDLGFPGTESNRIPEARNFSHKRRLHILDDGEDWHVAGETDSKLEV